MTAVTLSKGELVFLQETIELALEEFAGIEESRDDIESYILTTGAHEQLKEAHELICSWYMRLQNEELEELLEDGQE